MTPALDGQTLNAAKRVLTQQFKAAGLGTPALDARVLLMHVLGLDHAGLIAKGSEPLLSIHAKPLLQLAERRVSGEPIDHILGQREFYGRSFKISKDVLSPRPETEGLIDQALALYDEETNINCLDLGTGSGAIILSLLAERPHWNGAAIDISQAALDVARENAKALGLQARATFTRGSWFENIIGPFDLIVSNPPYIDKAHMAALSREVKDYDPALALYGGPDGLEAYRKIISGAPPYLKRGGGLILEIGYDQAAPILGLMKVNGFESVTCRQDLAGLDRIICGFKPLK